MGNLESVVVLQESLPPSLVRTSFVLHTEALVVSLDTEGLPAVQQTFAHGNGQQPHSLCLATHVSEADWDRRVDKGDLINPLIQGQSHTTYLSLAVLATANQLNNAILSFNYCTGDIRTRCMAFLQVMRYNFKNFLSSQGYYMSERDSRTAFGSSNVRGIHAFNWWKDTKARLNITHLADIGIPVTYGDSIPVWIQGVDTDQIDKAIEEHVKKTLYIRLARGHFWTSKTEFDDLTHTQGWVKDKSELVRRMSRARTCLFEMLGNRAICFDDTDGSAWSCLTFDYLTQHGTNRKEQRSAALFSGQCVPSAPTAILATDSAESESHQEQHLPPFARSSVTSICLQVCRVAGDKWGCKGELRGVMFLHAVRTNTQAYAKLVVKYHKLKRGGFGKCAWETTDEQEKLSSREAQDLVIALSSAMGGPPLHKDVTLQRQRGGGPVRTVSFDRLARLSDRLKDSEVQAIMGESTGKHGRVREQCTNWRASFGHLLTPFDIMAVDAAMWRAGSLCDTGE